MDIAIGSDHRGLKTKQFIIGLFEEAGHTYKDFGTYSEEPVDYPDVAKSVAEAVTGGDFEYGILICDTGIGMSIAANKVRGIIAALCHDAFTAARARLHNNANVLCLGTSGDPKTVRETVETFLNTEFEGGRHLRRLNKIKAMECK